MQATTIAAILNNVFCYAPPNICFFS